MVTKKTGGDVIEQRRFTRTKQRVASQILAPKAAVTVHLRRFFTLRWWFYRPYRRISVPHGPPYAVHGAKLRGFSLFIPISAIVTFVSDAFTHK